MVFAFGGLVVGGVDVIALVSIGRPISRQQVARSMSVGWWGLPSRRPVRRQTSSQHLDTSINSDRKRYKRRVSHLAGVIQRSDLPD